MERRTSQLDVSNVTGNGSTADTQFTVGNHSEVTTSLDQSGQWICNIVMRYSLLFALVELIPLVIVVIIVVIIVLVCIVVVAIMFCPNDPETNTKQKKTKTAKQKTHKSKKPKLEKSLPPISKKKVQKEADNSTVEDEMKPKSSGESKLASHASDALSGKGSAVSEAKSTPFKSKAAKNPMPQSKVAKKNVMGKDLSDIRSLGNALPKSTAREKRSKKPDKSVSSKKK